MRGTTHDRLRAAIRSLGDDPMPPDSIPMRGKGIGLRRLRVGSHRVIYRIQSERVTVLVIRIGHRSDVYGGFED
jgi:mRNA interferase RelE/StbE